jgi:ribosome biogenesis protein BMS1
MKHKYLKHFRPESPVILSRINVGEDNLGFLKLRFKRHRWYGNVMKSGDPIIMSSGWRRFQTIPTFCTEDPNDRLRFLKYTPEHDFCLAVVYGNFSQQNSGCVFMQTLNSDLRKFRIAASGIVLEINKTF